MTHQVVGYIRVSSQGQNTDRQLADIKLDKEFVDMVTGSTKDRKGLNECLAYVREGDRLVVHSIDRLARNLQDLQELVNTLINKGVSVQFIKENLTFNAHKDPIATLTLQIMGAFAEFERTMIRSRQKEGITQARLSGKHLGRKPKVDNKFRKVVKEKVESCQSIRSIAKELGVCRATIYKAIEEINEKGM